MYKPGVPISTYTLKKRRLGEKYGQTQENTPCFNRSSLQSSSADKKPFVGLIWISMPPISMPLLLTPAMEIGENKVGHGMEMQARPLADDSS